LTICPVKFGLKLIGSPSGNGAAALFFRITYPLMFVKSKIIYILDDNVAKNSLTTTDES
jgi:hypothetical protein